MCGIAGVWNGGSTQEVRGMMDRLRHRGPDGCGLLEVAGSLLGHTRLAIMDPEGGAQPLVRGDRAVVANGEIYNFPQIREKLGAAEFLTGTDSEAILHLYELYGTDTPKYLDGMFAFALQDGEDLFLARDPIGIKPLYIGETESGGLIFSSELKALVGIADRVREFPPGTWLHTGQGEERYYEIPSYRPRSWRPEEAAARLRETLERAVVKRLMSDVPLGAFLSGGLDSSLIVALARPHLKRMHTFAVGLEGSSDVLAARKVARSLDTDHHELLFSPEDVERALPKVVRSLESYDQDLVRSAVPCFFTSELASRYVKVVLTGEGADELFAGYTYYKGYRNPDNLGRELCRSVGSMHNINLQRVDRLTMAHSLEGRVPFLDTDVIELASTIPAELKLHKGTEKWVLRKAAEGLLPEEIVWREKIQFDEGSGSKDSIARAAVGWMTPEQTQSYQKEFHESKLRSSEECRYHQILASSFEDPAVVLSNVARWTDLREAHV